MKTLTLPDWYENNNTAIIERINKDLSNLKPDTRGFNYLFVGCTGSGKTVLAEMLMDHLKPKGIFFKKIYCDNYYRKYLNNDSQLDITGPDFKKNMFIDDLGDEKPRTQSAHDLLAEIITKRCNHIEKYGMYEENFNKLPSLTIVTTNLSFDLTEDEKKKGVNKPTIRSLYGERAANRIRGCFTIMKFKKESFRTRKLDVVGG